jgi:predicted secreted protein
MRILALLLLFLMGGERAYAANGAALGLIGFSPDGRFFAFEQYGHEDGSGFPYWDVFVIDLENNAWVKGTPVQLWLEEDGASLAQAREKARNAAAGTLKEANVIAPADVLAANPATEVVPERERVTFDRWYRSWGARADDNGTELGRHELSVERIVLPRPAGCHEDDGDTYGFTLTHKRLDDGVTRVIHKDARIPASRGCPVTYDIAAVVAQTGFPEKDRLVAIVGVYAKGFEGLDRRFIALPLMLKD